MKTNRMIVGIIILLSMTSCTTYYRMTSRIEKDGSLYREVYAKADSAFIAGDRTHNPFLFRIDAGWQLVNLDSAKKNNFWGDEELLNVKACRHLETVDGEYFSVPNGDEFLRPLAVPHESLKKHFRWFYTYYTYSAVYQELPDKGPVPLSDYMSEQQQQIWFRGDDAAFAGLNGMEINDRLNDIESRFAMWYTRSQYEISWEVIRHFVSMKGDTLFVHRLDEQKENVFKDYLSGDENVGNAEPDEVCGFFDKVCQTNFFSEMYKADQKAIDKMYEDNIRVAELFYHAIQFELTMPGRILFSDAAIQNNNTLIWRVDGFRLLTGEYVLNAESKVVNYWAFGITLMLILIALGIFWRRR